MIEITRHRLSNGMRVVHHYDGTTRMTTLNLLFDVGSKDDPSHRTGMAHLLEHLMFGGSLNVADFDAHLQRAGGENNAWTNSDITNYYSIIPTQNAETAFWLESDRLLGLAFSPQILKVQKQVVIEEYKQRMLNQPYGDISSLIRRMVYRVHPYRWPIIGRNIQEIEETTLDEVKNFYQNYYAPNNVILCVAGSLPLKTTLELCEKWFAPIPAREIPTRNLPQEELPKEERLFTVERPVPFDAVIKAYRMCGRKGADYQACDLLSDILGTGPSSILYKELVIEQRLFDNISASISGDIESGMFIINGRLNKGISLRRGNEAIKEIIERIKQVPVSEYTLTKTQNSFEANLLAENLSYVNKAANLAFYEFLGNAENINDEVAKYNSLTPERIQQTACKILLNDQCSTLFYRVEEN